MKTYQVSLPDEFAEFVDRMIAEKKWESIDDLVMAGLAALQDAMRFEDSLDPDWVRAEVQKGIDSANRGAPSSLNMDDIWEKVQERLRVTRRPVHAGSDQVNGS